MIEPVVTAQVPQKITGTALLHPKRKPTRRPPKDTPLGNIFPGWVRLLSGTPSMQVIAILDEDPPEVTGGYAGWEVLPRPRRRGLTIWKGSDPISLQVSFIVDYFDTLIEYSERERTNFCEADCRTLERMAGLDPHIRQPPYLVLDGGGGIPHDYRSAKRTRWVITDISWGDVIRAVSNSKRMRQHVSVTLMEFITEGKVDLSEAVKNRNKNRPADIIAVNARNWIHQYTVKKGDTLQEIAAKFAGSPKEWKLIAKANGIRDPKTLKVGQKLRVP